MNHLHEISISATAARLSFALHESSQQNLAKSQGAVYVFTASFDCEGWAREHSPRPESCVIEPFRLELKSEIQAREILLVIVISDTL